MDALQIFALQPVGVTVHVIGFFFSCEQCGTELYNQFLFNLLDEGENEVPSYAACTCPGCGVRFGTVKSPEPERIF